LAISFKARVLLELGAELISSDSVALYELIKNGIDAGSKKIFIDISMVLQPSAYRALRQRWENVNKIWNDADFRSDISDALEPTASDELRSDFLEYMSENGNKVEALDKLYDAFFKFNFIKVRDSGHGMDDSDLTTCYLTIGTPTRLLQKEKMLGSAGKVPLGEKGIGRLAAMRVGHFVRVRTSHETKQLGSIFELELDWRPVFADPTLDADALDFEPRKIRDDLSVSPGTQILIKDIQSDWNEEKLREMANVDLAKLADPFKSGYANQFIKINFQGQSLSLIDGFKTSSLQYSDASCTISFRSGGIESDGTVDGENALARLRVETLYSLHDKAEVLTYSGAHLADLVSQQPNRRSRPKATDKLAKSDELIAALDTLGDFEAKFWWFNRGRLQKTEKDLWRGGLHDFVRAWSGGLLVYRDGFRVYPYGAAADDWLDLDRKALASSAYKLNRAQIVGYLRIDSEHNSRLQDQTNREGFRDCPEKEAIKRLLRHAIASDCRTFLERIEKENKKADEETVRDIDERIADASESAVSNLRALKLRIPAESNSIQGILVELNEVQDAWGRAKEALAAKDYEVEQYAHLAGVGLMVELLAHELARSTDTALDMLQDKKTSGDPVKLEALEALLKTLNKRVRVIDELSIPGRQRKALFDIPELIKLIVEFYSAKFQRHGIEFEMNVSPGKGFSKRVEKGQILQIFDNLISNSAYWLARRLDRIAGPKITVNADSATGIISFFDNGPGIPDTIGEKIFAPFYTTKPKGGRGLGLYIARRLSKENDIELTLAPAEGAIHRGFIIKFTGK
jgi:signal transduction histidine kinase